MDELEAFQKEKAALKADLKEILPEQIDVWNSELSSIPMLKAQAESFCGLLESAKLRSWLVHLQARYVHILAKYLLFDFLNEFHFLFFFFEKNKS